jgi:hypothetical protein
MRVPSSSRLNPPFDGGRTGRQFSGAIFSNTDHGLGQPGALRGASFRSGEMALAPPFDARLDEVLRAPRPAGFGQNDGPGLAITHRD